MACLLHWSRCLELSRAGLDRKRRGSFWKVCYLIEARARDIVHSGLRPNKSHLRPVTCAGSVSGRVAFWRWRERSVGQTPMRKGTSVKLNLGCGQSKLEGFVNIDKFATHSP